MVELLHPQVVIVGAKGNVGEKLFEVLEDDRDIEVIGLVDPKFDKETGTQYADLTRILGLLIEPKPIYIDFTGPRGAEQNIPLYIANGVPFIVGSTGWDQNVLKRDLSQLRAPCVVAPNMSPTLVAIQAMFEYGAEHFPQVFTGFDGFQIEESHRTGKKDVSGTAKKLGGLLEAMGAPTAQIYSIRDVERPHGNHTFHLWKGGIGRDGVQVVLKTLIDDQYEYIRGVQMAIMFLAELMGKDHDPPLLPAEAYRVFSMVDILEDN